MFLRNYTPADCALLAELFYDTVHTVSQGDYTREQLDAWAPGTVDLDAWNRSFLAHDTVVAVENGTVAGFGDMDGTGYLDRLFVHKDLQGRGIASAICDRLERATGVDRLCADVSVTARPFFEKRGYTVVREQQAERNGVRLMNYHMEKYRLLAEGDV